MSDIHRFSSRRRGPAQQGAKVQVVCNSELDAADVFISHLARTEVRIFLEEWTRRIPAFTITSDSEIRTRGGHVWSPITLPLAWSVH